MVEENATIGKMATPRQILIASYDIVCVALTLLFY